MMTAKKGFMNLVRLAETILLFPFRVLHFLFIAIPVKVAPWLGLGVQLDNSKASKLVVEPKPKKPEIYNLNPSYKPLGVVGSKEFGNADEILGKNIMSGLKIDNNTTILPEVTCLTKEDGKYASLVPKNIKGFESKDELDSWKRLIKAYSDEMIRRIEGYMDQGVEFRSHVLKKVCGLAGCEESEFIRLQSNRDLANKAKKKITRIDEIFKVEALVSADTKKQYREQVWTPLCKLWEDECASFYSRFNERMRDIMRYYSENNMADKNGQWDAFLKEEVHHLSRIKVDRSRSNSGSRRQMSRT